MNHKDALDFVLSHQPVSGRADYDQDLLDRIGEVIDYFRTNPDTSILPNLIAMVGDGDAGGYWNDLADMLHDYPSSELVAALETTFKHGHESCAVWAADVLLQVDASDAYFGLCIDNMLSSPYPSVREKLAWAIRYFADKSNLEQLVMVVGEVKIKSVSDKLLESIEVIREGKVG